MAHCNCHFAYILCPISGLVMQNKWHGRIVLIPLGFIMSAVLWLFVWPV
jgi:hypothetical protein